MKDGSAKTVWSTDDARQSVGAGESLLVNQRLVSKSKEFWLLMHPSGEIAVGSIKQKLLWQSGTFSVIPGIHICSRHACRHV